MHADQSRWQDAERELTAARTELSVAPLPRQQEACDRLLTAERICTTIVHDFFRTLFELERVEDPRIVLSLDVDGVLESEVAGFTSTNLAGAAALKLLQLGRVGVLLNTARFLDEVRDRVDQFQLIGGVATLGAVTWDAIFGRAQEYWSETGALQLRGLRFALRADKSVVLHRHRDRCVRASRTCDGALLPIPAHVARQLIDEFSFDHLSFLVADRYTDFIDRTVDKGSGIERLRKDLGLSRIPMVAIGDSACDLPMLRLAETVLLPDQALPSYAPRGWQKFGRLQGAAGVSLWDAASQLVPDGKLRRRVLAIAGGVESTGWLPFPLRRPISTENGLFLRLVAAVSGTPGPDQVPLVAKGGR